MAASEGEGHGMGLFSNKVWMGVRDLLLLLRYRRRGEGYSSFGG
jgi:hypothetical protein